MDETTVQIEIVLNPYACKISIPDLNISIVSHATRNMSSNVEKIVHMLQTLANVASKEVNVGGHFEYWNSRDGNNE